MAEINDELAETLRRLSEEIGNMNAITLASNRSLRDQLQVQGKLSKASQDLSHTIDEENELREQAVEREKAFKSAQTQSISALKQFGSAITDTTNSFSKYEGGIKSLTGAISDVASQFGPLGKAVGLVSTAIGALAGAVLKQTDAVIKGYDDLSKLGGAVGLTADGIFKLGKEAGFSSQTLGSFTKGAKDAGQNLAALGTGTTEGVKAFSKFVAVGDEQLKQYRRLGFTQDELMEAQNTYLKQQLDAGRQITKSPQELQKASLQYIDSLLALAELTNTSLKQQQEAIDFANANENFNAYKFAMEQERLSLLKQADQETDQVRKRQLQAQASQIDQTVKAKEEFAILAKNTMSAANATAVLESISNKNGVVLTENNAKLQMAGIDIVKMGSNLNKGVNQSGELLGAQVNSANKFAKDFGEAAYAYGSASKDLQNTFGQDVKMRQTAAQYAKYASEEEQKAFIKKLAQNEDEIKKTKEAGKEGQKAVDMAAERESVERKLRGALDEAVNALNPFTGSVNGSAMAAAALTAAATAATYALTKLAITKMSGSALPGMADKAAKVGEVGKEAIKGAASSSSGIGNAAKAATSTLGKLAGPAAAVGAVVSGGYTAYTGYKKAEEEEKEGKITKQEATAKKGEAIGAGTGEAVGGVAGALKGAALGAALGSAVPVLGTAVGGIIGAALGGLAGTKIGEAIGGFAGKKIGEVAAGTAEKETKKVETAKKTQAVEPEREKQTPSVESSKEPKPEREKQTPSVESSKEPKSKSGRYYEVNGQPAKKTQAVEPEREKQTSSVEFSKEPKSKSGRYYEVNGQPATKEEYDANRAQFDKAKEKMPKMAKGGVTTGPSLAGEAGPEAVVPLPNGNKIPVEMQMPKLSNILDNERFESEEKLNEELEKTENILSKLTASLTKWEALTKEQIETKEEENEKIKNLQSATDVMSNAFKLASIDLGKFSSNIKIKLSEGTVQQKDKDTVADTIQGTGITAGKTSGTGITPGVKIGEGIKLGVGEQHKNLIDELKKQGITGTAKVSNIMAQVQAESGFKAQSEDVGKYSAKNLYDLYGPEQTKNKVRFKSMEEAKAVVEKGPEAVGNLLYGGRMGNAADEGYKYRGRGLIQLTGKSNYEKYGKMIGVNLVENPDLANDPQVASSLAAAYFADKEKRGVDLTDINAVNKAVGFAGGGAEAQKRASLAQGFASRDLSGGGVSVDSIDKILAFGGASGSKENFEGLQDSVENRVIEAAKMYASATGKKLQINSAKRDGEDQKRLYQESVDAGRPGRGPSGMAIAKPGTSKHERGLAVDIQNYSDPAAVSAMNQQGLFQTVPNDPVHFELPKAEFGGIFSGPMAGYPVELHGNEIVAPYDPNSMLAKMLTAPPGTEKEIPAIDTTTQPSNLIRDIQAMNVQMMDMIAVKLDTMIEALGTSNDLQNKLVTYSRT